MFVPVFLISFLFNLTLPDVADDWEKSMDKDGVVIYTRNPESSRFKEFLAKATMGGSLEEFKEILLDIDSYHEWMPDCKAADIVSKPSPTDVTYHMKLKVPFPFENRDIVQQLILHEKRQVLEIEIVNKPDKIKGEKKYVRMPVASGKWVVRNLSENKISVLFQYYADPGGNIPAWLVNSFIVKNPHKMMKRIRKKMAD